MKVVTRLGRLGKLIPGILGLLRSFAQLSLMFSSIDIVFHVSMLRMYVHDESNVLQCDVIKLDDCITFMEASFSIVARQVRRLHSRDIHVVKVCWKYLLDM